MMLIKASTSFEAAQRRLRQRCVPRIKRHHLSDNYTSFFVYMCETLRPGTRSGLSGRRNINKRINLIEVVAVVQTWSSAGQLAPPKSRQRTAPWTSAAQHSGFTSPQRLPTACLPLATDCWMTPLPQSIVSQVGKALHAVVRACSCSPAGQLCRLLRVTFRQSSSWALRM